MSNENKDWDAVNRDRQGNRIPPGTIIPPEDMTDAMLDSFGPVLLPRMTRDYEAKIEQLKIAVTNAADDDDALRKIRHELKEIECLLSRWADRVGNRYGAMVLESLQTLQARAGNVAESIAIAIQEEPGANDEEGEQWKNA